MGRKTGSERGKGSPHDPRGGCGGRRVGHGSRRPAGPQGRLRGGHPVGARARGGRGREPGPCEPCLPPGCDARRLPHRRGRRPDGCARCRCGRVRCAIPRRPGGDDAGERRGGPERPGHQRLEGSRAGAVGDALVRLERGAREGRADRGVVRAILCPGGVRAAADGGRGGGTGTRRRSAGAAGLLCRAFPCVFRDRRDRRRAGRRAQEYHRARRGDSGRPRDGVQHQGRAGDARAGRDHAPGGGARGGARDVRRARRHGGLDSHRHGAAVA